MSSKQEEFRFRKPEASDGYAIHQLIAASPPLDLNSTYAYYLLSSHFRDSCVVAERDGQLQGFISAYRLPQQPHTLFIWQVVVTQAERGQQIAWRMLQQLLQRPESASVKQLEVTVNPSNRASRRLFERLASHHSTTLHESLFLDATAFGTTGDHESEILLRVALDATTPPLKSPRV